ncbi:MAG: NUDIX domain-containing protein, partial [Candidatus Woesebacteria bacterium]|nr:NUDIX domain-containing protein [Candidatus Woesebacteria bacterium]
LKAGIIVWTIDPEGKPRFLIRHNRPFNGYEDEWTILFGNVETNEAEENTALRESEEEFGLSKANNVQKLNYEIEFTDKRGKTVIKFFAIRLKDIDTKIILNEESIGYDWMTITKVKEVMQHDDEKKAFDILIQVNALS